MDRKTKSCIRAIYDSIKNGPTVLGFDEERGVGVVVLLDQRTEEFDPVRAAEIPLPVLREAVNE